MLVQQVHANNHIMPFSAYDENGKEVSCFFPIFGDKLARDLQKTGALINSHIKEWNQSLGFLCRKDPQSGTEPYTLFFKRPNETVDEFIKALADNGLNSIILLDYSTFRFVSTNLVGLSILLDGLRIPKENND